MAEQDQPSTTSSSSSSSSSSLTTATPSSTSGYGYAHQLEYVSDFMRAKYERENGKNWEKFYKTKRGYLASTKNRDYLQLDLEEDLSGARRVLEIGCGGGHSIVPLAQKYPALEFVAIDVAPRAVALVKENADIPQDRCAAYVCDIQKEEVPIEAGSVDCAMIIFVLSSIAPEWHADVFCHIKRVLAPGGVVMFRDYAEGDANQLDFDRQYPPRKISKNFYVRPDGTRAYFFRPEEIHAAAAAAGLVVEELTPIVIEKRGNNRMFIKAKLRNPDIA